MRTIVILAMTADGKIAPADGSRANFASSVDKEHLRAQVQQLDAIMFGAGTLRAYGTTITVPNLDRQPVNIVVSASGCLSSELPFFTQSVPRWLVTTLDGAKVWQESNVPFFERVITTSPSLNWQVVWQQLSASGIKSLGILGGGKLVATLAALDLIDEFYLTICPTIVGGKDAPTPVDGVGLSSPQSLQLLNVQRVNDEIFLHYRRQN